MESTVIHLPINRSLAKSADQIANKNTINHYLPVRNRGNDFQWESVIGLVLRRALRKMIQDLDYDSFVNICQKYLVGKLSDKNFWDTIFKMYFKHEDILFVSPEFSLFRAQKGMFTKSEARVASIFSSLLEDHQIPEFNTRLNFLENDILNQFKSKLIPDQSLNSRESPYLPFLAENFKQDFTFLARRPHYLLSEIKQFLSLYAFIYCAQLSLNIDDWKSSLPPDPKPLFFIMDTEKASSERTYIKRYGFKSFHEASYKLFPMLSMLENIQPTDEQVIPLWQMYTVIQNSSLKDQVITELRDFSSAFKEQRELDTELSISNDLSDVMQDLMKLAIEQFASIKTTRNEINDKYVKEIQSQFGKHFIQTRGRAGRVLVLSQDYLILLTNLSVGESDRLQFHDLISQFSARGIFFDKQSQEALITFYERIGNIERMSDSGDAVYVKKTV